ncbi:HNH endonuclease [Micromonospora arborensis]|uniref:HNH endonuclease n=1 Tax=Micromonospora arborensis TaxID=2116518 RepID=UPI00371B75FA
MNTLVPLTYAARAALPARIASRINFAGPIPPDPFRPITTPCWLWTGWSNDSGYGYTRWQGRDQPAHRVVHTLVTGQALPGLDRDHVCRVLACVRPDHGEAVPHAENMARVSQHQKACRKVGHDWANPRNVYTRGDGTRFCSACNRDAKRRRRAERKATAGVALSGMQAAA